MTLLPPEITDIVLANYPLIIASLVGYSVIFVLITYAAKRKLAHEVSDYVVASRNLGWLVVTFTMYASILSGVGMAGIPGAVYTVGVPFVVTVLMGHTVALALLWYLGPRIWILGKTYNFTTPGDLLGDYYQSDTIRVCTVIASILFNVAFIVAQLLAGGVLLNVLSGSVISFELGVVIITVVVMVHVSSTGLRGIAWLDCFNGLLILFLLTLFGATILVAAGGLGNVLEGLGELKDQFITLPGTVGVFTPSHIFGIFIGLSIGAMVLSPSAWIRIYSASSKAHFAKISILMLVLWFISHIMGAFLIGSYARSVLPDVENPRFRLLFACLQGDAGFPGGAFPDNHTGCHHLDYGHLYAYSLGDGCPRFYSSRSLAWHDSGSGDHTQPGADGCHGRTECFAGLAQPGADYSFGHLWGWDHRPASPTFAGCGHLVPGLGAGGHHQYCCRHGTDLSVGARPSSQPGSSQYPAWARHCLFHQCRLICSHQLYDSTSAAGDG